MNNRVRSVQQLRTEASYQARQPPAEADQLSYMRMHVSHQITALPQPRTLAFDAGYQQLSVIEVLSYSNAL